MTTKFLLAAAVLAAAAPAYADRSSVTVDPSVTSVVFDRGTQTRVIAGDDGGAYIAIQRFANGAISDETWIDTLPIGGSNVPVSELKNLKLTLFSGGSLAFDAAPRVRGAKATIQCIAQLEYKKHRVRVTSASCDNDVVGTSSTPAAPAAPAQPAQPQGMEDIQAATTACNAAFNFDSEKKKCVDMTIDAMKTKFGASATKTVAACAAGFSFSSARFWCIETASRSTREPVALIRYCTEQNTFESEQKACMSKYATPLKP